MAIQINMDGKEIAKSISDLFSPLTESAGAIGDQVRIYRQMALLRAMKRARTIAENENLTLNPPPLKFLVPYMEQCSLESETDEVLMDMWSKLLVSTSTKFESEHNLFVRVLGELTASEATALEYIVSGEAHQFYESRAYLGEVCTDFSDSYSYISIRNAYRSLGVAPERDDEPAQAKYFEEFERLFLLERQKPGVVIDWFSVVSGAKNEYPHDDVYSGGHSIPKDIDSISFAILRSLGLIGEYESPDLWFGEYKFDFHAYYLTELGARFYCACTRNDCWVEGGASKLPSRKPTS